METVLNVEGMTCGHCKQSVEGALGELNGVQEASVDLDSGKVTVKHDENVSQQNLNEAVEDQGYDVVAQ